MRIPALLLAAFFIILFAGCRTVVVIPATTHSTVTHTRHVLPPHAPGHGYRHHYHDHDLEYDTGFGAYVVLGYDGIYFYNNLYIRYYAGGWQVVDRLDGTWHRAEHHHIPGKLRSHKRYRRHVPPPHAPAHGYRHHHHHGVDLVFDSGIGTYIVLGFDNLFFFNNHYMRFYDGYWHEADRHDGKWRRAKDRHIPHKLRKARKHEKKSLFKRLKKQYKKEHREKDEYRRKHENRKKNGKRRKDHDDDDNDNRRDRRDHRD